jgi:hypothetical protein
LNGRRIVVVAAGVAGCAVLSAVVASTLSARTNTAPNIVQSDGVEAPKGMLHLARRVRADVGTDQPVFATHGGLEQGDHFLYYDEGRLTAIRMGPSWMSAP